MKTLWTPSKERISNSPVFDFCNVIAKKYSKPIDSIEALYEWSIAENEAFWREVWDFCEIIGDRGEKTLEKNKAMYLAKFFPDSHLNFASNLLRFAVDPVISQQCALSAWSESQHTHSVSYQHLFEEVIRVRKFLIDSDIQSGDVVAGYVANTPLAVVAMLATTSLGAIWTSCSPDFGVAGVLDRFGQTKPKVLFTSEEYIFKGNTICLQDKINEIASSIPSLKKVFRESELHLFQQPSSISLDEIKKEFSTWQLFPFNHPLVILYSSGTTGKPKCIIHRSGGVLLEHIKELKLHVGLKHNDVIFYQTTCGWMMWNWLISSLFCGSKVILYDGSPIEKNGSILFDIVDKEKITVFGTNAKWISIIQKLNLSPKKSHVLSSLHTILSTGSPLSKENFEYVYDECKKDICLSSISGGTDILGCFALGSETLPVVPGELQTRSLGLAVEVWDENQNAITDQTGELVCTKPFPSQPLGFWGDHSFEKYHSAYFYRNESVWYHGDFVTLTNRGSMIFYGRSDAVLNPGGVRIGTAEIYAQVEKIPEILESIVSGRNKDNDVEVFLFITLQKGKVLDNALIEKIRKTIRTNATAFHVPKHILQVSEIPKTRNGKLIELAIGDILNNRTIRNIESLQNPEALEEFYLLAKKY